MFVKWTIALMDYKGVEISPRAPHHIILTTRPAFETVSVIELRNRPL